MKVIIAGSRSITSFEDVSAAIIASGFTITEVVSGGAAGVDTMGEQWAATAGLPVKRFLPDWEQFGKAAGPIRNRDMAKYADLAIVVWDGKSAGSRSMINEMSKAGKMVYVHPINYKE